MKARGIRLRTVMIAIALIAGLLSIEAGRRRSIDWRSPRLEQGSEMVIFLAAKTESVIMMDAKGSRHTNGLFYEALSVGTKVRVDSDTNSASVPVIDLEQEQTAQIINDRDVRVTVISGPKSGISGIVGRRFLRPAN